MVEGTVGFGQGAALWEVNTDTCLLYDGSCRCEKRKSEGEQAGFAEHGEGQCELLGSRRGRGTRQVDLVAIDLSVVLLKYVSCKPEILGKPGVMHMM